MKPATTDKIILVTRQTRLQELVAQQNTLAQARFFLTSRGSDFAEYQQEHDRYQQALNQVTQRLQAIAPVQTLERSFLPNFIFSSRDVVVVLGQDGLVANVLKYLDQQPVVAINPDPQRYDGLLLPFRVAEVAIVKEVLKQRYRAKAITMAQAQVNDGQTLLAVNDFFIGPRYPLSARYQLQIDGQQENQLSSGIIVSTGLGSSGWLKSILAGASGIMGQAQPVASQPFAWDSRCLYYAVREPFASKTTHTQLVYGKIAENSPLVIASQMAINGILFSDGMLDDYIEFNSGTRVEIGLAEKQGYLVV